MVRQSKKKHTFIILPMVLGIVLLILTFFYWKNYNRERIFSECVEHVDNSPTHTHTMLTIIQDGKQIVIPKNLGITSDCMHPLHTHDETGLIHMEYPNPTTFYLGDFFNVMGVIFSDNQIGAIKTADGYKVKVTRNGKLVDKNFRNIPLKDKERIEIEIESIKDSKTSNGKSDMRVDPHN